MHKKGKYLSIISLVIVGIFIFSLVFAGVGCTKTATSAAAETTAAAAETTSAAAETTAAAVADSGKSGFQGKPGETYYYVTYVSGAEYYVPVYETFKQAGRQLGVKTVYAGTPEFDLQKQITVFEQVVALNPTGIYIVPMEPEAFTDPINNAVDKGIAVVTSCNDVPNSKRQAFVKQDDINIGIFAADQLAAAIGGKGKLAVIENPGVLGHEIRVKNFLDRIAEKYPDITIAGRAASGQNAEKAYTGVLTIAQKDPDLGGVFIPEATSGMGAAKAAQELGGKIKVICCDVNKEVLDMIKAGTIYGAINPNQGLQGYFGLLVTYLAAHPDLMDPMNGDTANGINPFKSLVIDNGVELVTKENADYFYLDKYLQRLGSKGLEE